MKPSLPVPRIRNLSLPANVAVTTELRERGAPSAQNVNAASIPTPFAPINEAPAYVGVTNADSRCVNFNTTRVEVTVMVPCAPHESAILEAKEWASGLAKQFLEEEKRLVGGVFEDTTQTPHAAPAPAGPRYIPPPSRPATAPPPGYSGILRSGI